jgi:hypothetical protein
MGLINEANAVPKSVLLFQEKREVIEYLFQTELIGIIDFSGRRCFTARNVLDIYRANRHQFYCVAIERDRWNERFWVKGYAEGIKAMCEAHGCAVPGDVVAYLAGGKTPQVSVPRPSNALSRLCSELVFMEKGGLLMRVNRGVYTYKMDMLQKVTGNDTGENDSGNNLKIIRPQADAGMSAFGQE